MQRELNKNYKSNEYNDNRDNNNKNNNNNNNKKDEEEEKGYKTVGDGGRGWRNKLLIHAKEQAKEEGKTIEEVASNKWEIESLMNKETINTNRRKQGYNDSSYLKDNRQIMLPPSNNSSSSLRWKNNKNDNKFKKEEQQENRYDDESYDRELIVENKPELNRISAPTITNNNSNNSNNSSGGVGSGKNANQIAALMIKAKISGNKELYNELQQQLEQMKEEGNSGNGRKETVIVPIDERGKAIPIELSNYSSNVKVNKRGKFEDKDKDGNRIRYYKDDDLSLNQLIQREKLEGQDQYNLNFANNLVNKKNFKFDMDEFDEHHDMWENKKKKKSHSKQEEIQRQKAMNANNKMNKVLSNCWFCYDNPQMDKSLVISLGNSVYLALPKRGRLTTGHCLIIPMQHQIASNLVDEDVWEEIQSFRKCLVKMFQAQKKDVIFFEIAMQFNRQIHTFIECVPIPRKQAMEAPMYFKKAILESESEWSQHKKIIETTGRGLKKSIPAGFPYFFVEFNMEGGYVHVVEDEIKFTRYFGREVIAGMLHLDPEQWMRPQDEHPQQMRDQLKQFLQMWEPYDWTVELEGGEYDASKQ